MGTRNFILKMRLMPPKSCQLLNFYNDLSMQFDEISFIGSRDIIGHKILWVQ